jgi:hypothetical protein
VTDQKDAALARFDAAHAAIAGAFGEMPDAALSWLKPGDDYAIGGVLIHLIQSLDGYLGTLSALRAAGYVDTEAPAEDEALVEDQLAHARRGIAPAERSATFDELRSKHARLRDVADAASDAQFAAVVAVTYAGDDVPYPTSAALVVQWMTEHYAEHVPHVRQLFAEWEASR